MGFMLNFIIHNFKTRLQNYYLFDSSFCLLYNLSMRNIIDMLNDSKDVVYKSFNSKLIPNIDKDGIIGVRVPDIRKIAKKVNDLGIGDEFLNDLPHSFFEENMLHAILLNDLHDIETLINYLDKFLPFVDNWAVCDIIKPKIFKKYPDKVFDKINEWVNSKNEYTVRFGVVCLLNFFLDDLFTDKINDIVVNIHREEYYINMAIAWYFSYALIKQYESTIKIFENMVLDKWVHNKSITKAIESYRVSEEVKNYLKGLRIK